MEQNYELMIKEFEHANYLEKKKKLLALLWTLSDLSPKMKMLSVFLQEDRVNEKNLLEVYKSILLSIKTVVGDKKDMEMRRTEKIIDQINIIREQEMLDQQKEDPEAILSQLEKISL